MIQSYFGSMLFTCVAVLVLYLPLRLAFLRLRRAKIDWAYELWLALLVCYLGGLLSQTVLPELLFSRGGDGSLALNVLFYSGNQLVLSKHGFEWVYAAQPLMRRWNLVPFHTIVSYLKADGYAVSVSVRAINLLGNVLVLVPFGVLLPLAFPKMQKWSRVFLCGSALILLIEVTQFFVGRAADIDDYILNILGVMLGYALLRLCLYGVRSVRPVPNAADGLS